MVVLSYGAAKKSLLTMALYLVCVSLIIKGLGYLLEFSFLATFQSLVSGVSINFELPQFNLDSFSFDMIANAIQGQIKEILQTLLATVAFIGPVQTQNIAMYSKKVILKV